MKKREFFKVEGDHINRIRKHCPKCGPAVFLADHKNRFSCGKCGYTEFKGGGRKEPQPLKVEEKPEISPEPQIEEPKEQIPTSEPNPQIGEPIKEEQPVEKKSTKDDKPIEESKEDQTEEPPKEETTELDEHPPEEKKENISETKEKSEEKVDQ